MAKYDIYYTDVAFSDKPGSKERYAIIVDENTAFVYTLNTITSQYEKKSDFIKLQYFPIEFWKEAGLKKASYIDILSPIKVPFDSLLKQARFSGSLAVKDKRGLETFILSYDKRVTAFKSGK